MSVDTVDDLEAKNWKLTRKYPPKAEFTKSLIDDLSIEVYKLVRMSKEFRIAREAALQRFRPKRGSWYSLSFKKRKSAAANGTTPKVLLEDPELDD